MVDHYEIELNQFLKDIQQVLHMLVYKKLIVFIYKFKVLNLTKDLKHDDGSWGRVD